MYRRTMLQFFYFLRYEVYPQLQEQWHAFRYPERHRRMAAVRTALVHDIYTTHH